ncbi:MAG: winged helix-turn-helix transcriptional regulator [Acetivibrionales bacterium]|jgi:DNA-binding MarR family transcriptional regulator
MESELRILNTIEKNNSATQREIAKSTGMSLGNVNILIKRLVKKGMIKIERLNPRTIRYILTPHGFREKAEITYRYIVSSYRYINDVDRKINILLKKHLGENKCRVYLFGSRDEIYEILVNNLNNSGSEYTQLNTIEEVKACPGIMQEERPVVIAWQPEPVEMLKQAGIKCIYLMQEI